MRLTGGRAKGRVLKGRIPAGVRPTSSRVREALFSVLGQDLAGQHVLDAFAGSGLLGLEAWSRGAVVTAIERDRRHAALARTHAQSLGAEGDGWSIVVGDVTRAAARSGPFEGILADPPYADPPERWLAVLAPHTTRWLVLEADSKAMLPSLVDHLVLDRPRPFGGTTLWVYRREDG